MLRRYSLFLSVNRLRRALVCLGFIRGYSGDAEEAARSIERALPVLEQELKRLEAKEAKLK